MTDNDNLFYKELYDLQRKLPEHYKKSGFAEITYDEKNDTYSVVLPKFKPKPKGDDGNANTRDRYIGILTREFTNPLQKVESYRILFDKLVSQWGRYDAIKFLRADIVGKIYTHNGVEISSKPYCFAYDFERLAKEGAYFTDIADRPAQHLDSFIQHIIEFVAVTCRETTGAVGMPALFPYMWYFWDKDVKSGYTKAPAKYLEQQIQMLVYKLNGSEMRMNESAFTNVSCMDESYIEHFFGDRLFPDGEPVIKHVDEIVEVEMFFLKVINDILAHKVMTFPVITDCMLFDEEKGKFVNEKTARRFSDLNMKWNNANMYCGTDISTLSTCCRVLNNVDTMNEKLRGFANFIGGSDLNIGSVAVVTVNLPHYAQRALAYARDTGIDREETIAIFKSELETAITLSCKTLHSARNVIEDLIDKKALKLYDLGLATLSRQFLTSGFIGIFDAAKLLVPSGDDADILEFEKDILLMFKDVTEKFAKDEKYSINIEQIPGESACVKLAQKDKLTFGEDLVETNCYSNQWIPLSEYRSIDDRSKFAAVLDKLCGGGSILHLNIDSPFANSDMAWDLLNHIAKRGVIYFAFNNKISVCEEEHGFYGDTCWCGKPKVGEATRPVGFITIVKNWIPSRQEEYKERKWIEIK